MLRKIVLSGTTRLVGIPGPNALMVEREGKQILNAPIGLRIWSDTGSRIDLDPNKLKPLDCLIRLEEQVTSVIFYALLQFIFEQQQLRLERFGKPYTVNASQQRYQVKPRWFRVHDYIRVVVAQGGEFDILLSQLNAYWVEKNLWERVLGLIEYIWQFRTSDARIEQLYQALASQEMACFSRPDVLAFLYSQLNQIEVEGTLNWLQQWGVLTADKAASLFEGAVSPFSEPCLPGGLKEAILGINVWHRPRIFSRYPWSVYDLYAPEYESG